jgi:hypothetical protein
MLAWLYERENLKFGPVELPAYGPRAPLTALPEVPSANVAKEGPPNPWVGAQPGAYFTVPGAQPTPGRFFYEGGLPSSLGGRSNDPQHAADMARYFCQLAPGA